MTEPTYTQADLDAAVAAALEEAVKVVKGVSSQKCGRCGHHRDNHLFRHPFVATTLIDPAEAIRDLRPDARVILEARDRAKVAEGMRRAAEWIDEMRVSNRTHAVNGLRAEAEKVERGGAHDV